MVYRWRDANHGVYDGQSVRQSGAFRLLVAECHNVYGNIQRQRRKRAAVEQERDERRDLRDVAHAYPQRLYVRRMVYRWRDASHSVNDGQPVGKSGAFRLLVAECHNAYCNLQRQRRERVAVEQERHARRNLRRFADAYPHGLCVRRVVYRFRRRNASHGGDGGQPVRQSGAFRPLDKNRRDAYGDVQRQRRERVAVEQERHARRNLRRFADA